MSQIPLSDYIISRMDMSNDMLAQVAADLISSPGKFNEIGSKLMKKSKQSIDKNHLCHSLTIFYSFQESILPSCRFPAMNHQVKFFILVGALEVRNESFMSHQQVGKFSFKQVTQLEKSENFVLSACTRFLLQHSV